MEVAFQKVKEETNCAFSRLLKVFLRSQITASVKSKLNLCLRTNSDTQPQPNTCTSCAGGEPGSDSSLARGRTTPSRLLLLHYDEVCLEIQSSGAQDAVKTMWLSHQFAAKEHATSVRQLEKTTAGLKIKKCQMFKSAKVKTENISRLKQVLGLISILFPKMWKRKVLTHSTFWKCVSL